MFNKYFINNREYTHSGILSYSENRLKKSDSIEWEKVLYSFIIRWLSPAEHITVRTSGSTGTPKNINIAKKLMIRSAQRSLDYFGLKPYENVLLCLPAGYIAGMMMIVRAFTGMLNLITIQPDGLFSNDLADIDFAAMVPLQVEKLFRVHNEPNFIKKLIIGGTPVSQELEKKLKDHFKGMVWETYGMTETLTHIAVRKIGTSMKYFEALPGISLSIDNQNRLIINDPYLHDKPINTNDIVELMTDTRFRLIGRFDNIINSGGIKIQPEELEQLLIPFIKNKFCISSVTDDTFGEMIVLVTEQNEDSNLINQGIEMIDKIYRPKKIIKLKNIPVNANGKIDRILIKKTILKFT